METAGGGHLMVSKSTMVTTEKQQPRKLKMLTLIENDWNKQKGGMTKQFINLDNIKWTESTLHEDSANEDNAGPNDDAPVTKTLVMGKKLKEEREFEPSNFKFEESEEGIIKKFSPYRTIIENLTSSITINTKYDVVSCDWTNDGERLLVVVMKEDEFYQIR